MQSVTPVSAGAVSFGTGHPLAFILGPCVIESESHAIDTAIALKEIGTRLGVPIASLWVNLVPFFAVLWSMVYGFVPNAYQIVGGLVALSGVVYMQWRKLGAPRP